MKGAKSVGAKSVGAQSVGAQSVGAMSVGNEKESDEKEALSPYRDSAAYRDLLQPVLIALLVAALLAGPIVFLQLFYPDGSWFVLKAAVFLIALEAIYTTRWLARPEQRQVSRLAYRAAEFAVIVVALRLLTWTIGDGLPTAAEWREFLLSPTSLIDGTYFLFLFFAVFALERGASLAALFIGLDLSNDEIAYYTLSPHARELVVHERPPLTNRPQLLRSFFSQWIFGGALLALFAVLTVVDFAAFDGRGDGVRTLSRLGLRPELLLALLVYFLVGLWLTSHARLAVMRARWLVAGITTAGDVSLSWRRSSLLLLLLVATVAAFLPIGSTIAVAAILEAIFTVGAMVVYTAVSLILLLFFGLVALFFNQESPLPEEEFMEPLATPAPAQAPPVVTGDEASLVMGALFWLVVAAVLVVALFFFLRDRGYHLEVSTFGRAWSGFARWLRRLWRSLSGGAAEIGQALRQRLRRQDGATGAAARPWRFLRVNALTPRDQVRYFYLSAARRAGEKGVAREAGETPLEYAQDLERTWPQAEEDIETLTHAFLKARYSRQEIAGDEAGLVKRTWRRIRSILKLKVAG
jgi:hypothetical protein